jgi:hypothetical protein
MQSDGTRLPRFRQVRRLDAGPVALTADEDGRPPEVGVVIDLPDQEVGDVSA